MRMVVSSPGNASILKSGIHSRVWVSLCVDLTISSGMVRLNALKSRLPKKKLLDKSANEQIVSATVGVCFSKPHIS